MENRHPGGVPFNLFEASDGHVFIAVVTDNDWNNLLSAMDRKDLVGDPQFSGLPNRLEHLDEIEAMIKDWVKEHSRDYVVDVLQANKVAVGPVLSMSESLDSSQLRDREMLVPLKHPNSEKIPDVVGLGMPIRFTENPIRFDRRAPAQGEHNEEIFGDLLEIGPGELAELKARDVI